MDRKEAIETIRRCMPRVGDSQCDFETALRELIPELAESEDERIRKVIYQIALGIRGEVFSAQDEIATKDKVLAWLEKQKDIEERWFKDREGCFWDGVAEGRKQKELFESGRGLYYYDGEKTTYCGYPATEENPYDFAMKQQKEQKPVEKQVSRVQVHHELLQNGTITMEEYLKLPENLYFPKKPKPKQDYSDLNALERAILRGFLCAGVENVPVGIIKETAKECLAHLPAEWSEADEAMRNNIIRVLSAFVGTVECESNPSLSSSYPTYLREIAWLKSLRPQTKRDGGDDYNKGYIKGRADTLKEFNDMPSWKPSEEQMDELRKVLIPGETFDCDILIGLLERLEELM